MATNASPAGSGKTAAKMAIEHSATVDKGLKMKIKRTKPGTKTSEAKHEIVKSNEQNGNADGNEIKGAAKHPSNTPNAGGGGGGGGGGGTLRSFDFLVAALLWNFFRCIEEIIFNGFLMGFYITIFKYYVST